MKCLQQFTTFFYACFKKNESWDIFLTGGSSITSTIRMQLNKTIVRQAVGMFTEKPPTIIDSVMGFELWSPPAGQHLAVLIPKLKFKIALPCRFTSDRLSKN